MADKLTVSDIRELYNEISEANRTLPDFDEVDFETKWMMIELLRREMLGITASQSASDGDDLDDRISSQISAIETNANIYDQAGFIMGQPTASQRIYLFISARDFTIPEDFEGSRAYAVTPSHSTAVFTILKNGIQVGTLTFYAGVSMGTFSSTEDIVVLDTDKLELLAPSSQDDDLSDITWTIIGSLSTDTSTTTEGAS